MPELKLLTEKHKYEAGGGWSRKVAVDGREFFVGVERGKKVKIAFKPRGRNVGWHWWGFVRDATGKTLWEDRVTKNLGARGLLREAGILPVGEKEG